MNYSYYLIFPLPDVVMRVDRDAYEHDRYDYKKNAWVRDDEYYYRAFQNSNDADEISREKAKEIIEAYGGTFTD